MLRLLTLMAAFLCLAAAGSAQETPLMGSQATDMQAAADPQGETYRILVIGDALAGGLGAGLGRVVDGESQFEVANRFQEVSGIARPEVYDWTESAPKLMADKAFNAVVVLIGSNDRQDIRRENFQFSFNSPDWVKAYQQRTDGLLAVLKNSGVKVFWVSLPPMGDARYDADMRAITELQRQRVEAAGAYFIDLRPAFLDAGGNYAARGPDDTGTVRNLRDSDGIAFTKAGNTKFGSLLLEEIKRRIEGKTDLPMTTLADPPPIVAPDASGPVFGNGSEQGQISLNLPAGAARPGLSPAAMPDLSGTPVAARELAPGSQAEKLYVQGVSATAPPGRFDDFRLPEPAP